MKSKILNLKSIKFKETLNNELFWENKKLLVDNFNLIIGPNASGKSSLFNRIKFLKKVHNKKRETPQIITVAAFELEFNDCINSEVISYKLTISPNQEITEIIKNNTKNIELFSTKKKQFYNEKLNQHEERLIPKKISVTKLVDDYQSLYPTIYSIGKYISNIQFLQADQIDLKEVISINGNGPIPDSKLKNLGAVVLNWKKNNSDLYDELFSLFIQYFPFVEEFVEIQRENLPFPILGIKEKEVDGEILYVEMSLGMLRILGILTFAISRHPNSGSIPSLIVIDEVDNGLDYNNIGKIVEFIKDNSEDTQYLLSSHSPVICNFVPPKHWRIFSRNNVTVNVKVPTENKNTNELIQTNKMSNWDIYKNHISKSNDYK